MTPGVVRLDPGDARWDAYVRDHPDALVYHHPAWFQTLRRAYGHDPTVLAVENGSGALEGVLPLLRKRGILTGHRLASLPHTPAAGPLASSREATAALIAAATALARERPGLQLEVKTATPLVDAEGLEPSESGTRYVLPLPEEGEVRFGNSRNHGRIRWAVRRAERSGVRVREAGDVSDLRSWHRLYLETMRDHVVPPLPFRFFRAAWETLRPSGLMRLLLAERTGARGTSSMVAGSVFLVLGATTVYAYNGRRRADLHVRPNDVIQWHAIHDAAAAGMRVYDFGEVSADQDGLAEFKRKWGAHPMPLHTYSFGASTPREGRAEAGAGAPRWAESLWRRLPLDVTAAVGALAYRYL